MTSNQTFLYAAYGIAVVALVLYAITLYVRRGNLRKRERGEGE